VGDASAGKKEKRERGFTGSEQEGRRMKKPFILTGQSNGKKRSEEEKKKKGNFNQYAFLSRRRK